MLHVLLLRQCHHIVSVFLTRHVNSEITCYIGIIIADVTPPSGFGRWTLRLFVGTHGRWEGHATPSGIVGHHMTRRDLGGLILGGLGSHGWSSIL